MMADWVLSGMWAGRIGRQQYLVNYLILTIGGVILGFPLAFWFGLSIYNVSLAEALLSFLVLFILSIIQTVFVFSLHIRRLHDINQTGLWSLLTLLPFIGFLLLLALIFIGGDSTSNRYGAPNDKGILSAMFGRY